MIPYLTIPRFELGPVVIDHFMVLVATAVIVGVVLYDRMLLRGGVEIRVARNIVEVCLAGGFIGAHLVHVLVYHPWLMKDDPWVLLYFWSGLSSIGGFFGGAVAGCAYLKIKRHPVVPVGDRVLLALLAAWNFGRLGCTFAHDHPGIATDFFLGVRFPDGVVRHDLGFYEFLWAVTLSAILFPLSRRPRREGFYMGIILTSYAPLRFLFDFLRVTEGKWADVRFVGLTPAQYGTLLLFGFGVWLLIRQRSRPYHPALLGTIQGGKSQDSDRKSAETGEKR